MCNSSHNNSGLYVKCTYAMWNGKGKKKSSLRAPKLGGVTELKSGNMKTTADIAPEHAHTQSHAQSHANSNSNTHSGAVKESTINFREYMFTLCPSHGGLEWAEYVCLEIHTTDMLSDTIFGKIYIPMSDFSIVEEEKTYSVCHKENLSSSSHSNEGAKMTIRLKRLWAVPMSSSAASVFSAGSGTANSNNICSETGSDQNRMSAAGSVEDLKSENLCYGTTLHPDENGNISTSTTVTSDVYTQQPGINVPSGSKVPKKSKGIVQNVGHGIYQGVAGGVGMATGIGMGIAGGIGVAGGMAGGIGVGIVGGIAGGIAGGIGLAGGMVGIAGARSPEHVGVVTLRCLLKESSEYYSMWPAESVLAGALRDNSAVYTVENFCVASAYEGIVLQEVSESELVFNRRLKPISFITDIFNLGSKSSTTSQPSFKISTSDESQETTKKVTFLTPTKPSSREEKQVKKDEKNTKKEEKSSLALLEINENAQIKKSSLLAEYVAQVEENERKIVMLKKQSSKQILVQRQGGPTDDEVPNEVGAKLKLQNEERGREAEFSSSDDNESDENNGIPDDVSELEMDMAATSSAGTSRYIPPCPSVLTHIDVIPNCMIYFPHGFLNSSPSSPLSPTSSPPPVPIGEGLPL
jgi:hypothetical protein